MLFISLWRKQVMSICQQSLYSHDLNYDKRGEPMVRLFCRNILFFYLYSWIFMED